MDNNGNQLVTGKLAIGFSGNRDGFIGNGSRFTQEIGGDRCRGTDDKVFQTSGNRRDDEAKLLYVVRRNKVVATGKLLFR